MNKSQCFIVTNFTEIWQEDLAEWNYRVVHWCGVKCWVSIREEAKRLCGTVQAFVVEMGSDTTRAYFWPAVNKMPVCLWPGYFLMGQITICWTNFWRISLQFIKSLLVKISLVFLALHLGLHLNPALNQLISTYSDLIDDYEIWLIVIWSNYVALDFPARFCLLDWK